MCSNRPRYFASLSRRDSSARFCPVMSREMPKSPLTRAAFVDNRTLRREEDHLFPFPGREMILVCQRLPDGDDAPVAFHDRPGFLGGKQKGIVVSDHLGGTLPREAQCRGVHETVTSLQILDVDSICRPVHHRLQEILGFQDLPLRLAQFLLRPAVFGDIALEGEHRLDHPLRVPLGHKPPVEDHRPLLSLQRELGLVRHAAVEHTPDGLLPEPGLRFGKAKLAMGLADELLHREVDHVADVIGYEQVSSRRGQSASRRPAAPPPPPGTVPRSP